MDDSVQNGLRAEQWLSTYEKGEKRSGSLGSGALRFIRTRSSIRRELKRQSTRSKNGDSYASREASGGNGGGSGGGSGGGGGGGLGKWLREHLGGSTRGNHNAVANLPSKTNGNANDGTMYEKSFGRATYVSQNLYCSLPREQGRHFHNGHRKTNHCGAPKNQNHERPRSSSVNYHEKFSSADLGILTRGGPFYGSEGKSLRKRNRDRRRYSLNETHEQGRQRRKSHLRFVEECKEPVMAEDEYETDQTSALATMTKSNEDVAEVSGDFRSSIDAFNKPLIAQDVEIDLENVTTLLQADDEFQRYSLYDLREEEEEHTTGVEDKESRHEEEVKDAYAEEQRSYDERKFPERFRESDQEEEEKDVSRRSEGSRTTEKFEEEVPEVESDHVFAEIPAEILADREAMLNKLKELQLEYPSLRRKNRLLEIFVAKHCAKIQRKLTPLDTSQSPEDIDKMYKLALRSYKLEVDEIMARRSQMMVEIEAYKQSVQTVREEDERNFKEFLDCEKSVAIGLVYSKSGRKITEKAIKEIIHHQITRRDTLTRTRLKYILYQHRLNKIERLIRDLEVLGPGMTTMDYEALRMVNVVHKDKLDDRDRELEKLRAKLEGMANTLAHFKEKKLCLIEDIENEGQILNAYSEKTRKTREDVNELHATLKKVRREQASKRFEAGLLLARPELREMERTKSQLDALKNDVELIRNEIQQYARPNDNRQRKRSKTLTMSAMTKYTVKHTRHGRSC